MHFSRVEEKCIQHAINFVDRCDPGTEVLFAAYSFTIKELANALIAAHQRGCIVKVIVEGTRSSSQAKCVICFLQDAGVEVKQDKVPKYWDDGSYQRDEDGDIAWQYKGSTLHHNKYIVEYKEDPETGELLRGAVFTGSFNFSKNAERNWENILITRAKDVVIGYRDNFINVMWNNSKYFDVIPPEAPVSYKYRGVYSPVDCNDPKWWD
jgi:phosphatidylserine/phosphatidylglycerophosphate/cardiolipin synthase-like enzyme